MSGAPSEVPQAQLARARASRWSAKRRLTASVAARLLSLAAAALLAGLVALAVLESRRRTRAPAAQTQGAVAPGGWYEALAVTRGPAGDAERTTCGLTLTSRSLGVTHPVLPCHTKILVRYGDQTLFTEVIDTKLKSPANPVRADRGHRPPARPRRHPTGRVALRHRVRAGRVVRARPCAWPRAQSVNQHDHEGSLGRGKALPTPRPAPTWERKVRFRPGASSAGWSTSALTGVRSDVSAAAGPGAGIVGIDHVQVAAPPGCEDDARRFYGELLGLEEIDEPPLMAARGGCWFRVGPQELHVGVAARLRAGGEGPPGAARRFAGDPQRAGRAPDRRRRGGRLG